MTVQAPPQASTYRHVDANGLDIHYVEAGSGAPLLLIDNAMVTGNPIWAGHPSAYVTHLDAFAQHFRVIVPDTRGSGRTVHPGGPITHNLLADDVLALIEALDLDSPMICGFSDGGEVATIVGIKSAGIKSAGIKSAGIKSAGIKSAGIKSVAAQGSRSVRAIVNHGGYDLFNPDPQCPAMVLTRQMLGGSPDATHADFDALAHLAAQVPDLAAMFELMEADHDQAQGPDHWKVVIDQTFDRIVQPHGYTVEALRDVTAPTLILVGDRDMFCTVEEGTACFRALPAGELAVLPNTGHQIDTTAVNAVIEFFRRHTGDEN